MLCDLESELLFESNLELQQLKCKCKVFPCADFKHFSQRNSVATTMVVVANLRSLQSSEPNFWGAWSQGIVWQFKFKVKWVANLRSLIIYYKIRLKKPSWKDLQIPFWRRFSSSIMFLNVAFALTKMKEIL